MDNEEELKKLKAQQLLRLGDAINQCTGPSAKGHGLFLYTHDDDTHMTVLTFNTDPDDIYSMIQYANMIVTKTIESVMVDAPPREKYN